MHVHVSLSTSQVRTYPTCVGRGICKMCRNQLFHWRDTAPDTHLHNSTTLNHDVCHTVKGEQPIGRSSAKSRDSRRSVPRARRNYCQQRRMKLRERRLSFVLIKSKE